MALNFALQELKIDYDNSNELRVEEEKKGSPMKVHFIYYYYLFFYCNYIATFFNRSRPSGDQTSTFSGPVQF